MDSKKIYIVYSYGGEWEDKWEHNEYAFTTKEAAEAYIKEQEESGNKIGDEQWNEIEQYLAEKELDMQCKYYDPNTAQLYENTKEEDYYAEYDEFDNITKYELVKEKFGIEKEEYDKKEYDMSYDFCGYGISEVNLHE